MMAVRISREQAARLLPPDALPLARSKYGSRRTEYNGVVYQSKAEADRAAYLDAEMAAGRVRLWIPQPTFRLGCPENVYRGDFFVVEWGGNHVRCEDVKGYRTAKFNHIVNLWVAYGPCPLWIIERGGIDILPAGWKRNQP